MLKLSFGFRFFSIKITKVIAMSALIKLPRIEVPQSIWYLNPHQGFSEVFYFAGFFVFAKLDGVALVCEAGSLVFKSAGVFFVEFPFGFQRPPVRSNISFALFRILSGCTSRNPGKDAGGYRSANGGAVSFSHHLSNLVYGDKFASWNLPHNFIHFQRCRDNNRACPPPLAHVFSDFYYLWEIFAVGQFLPP